MQRFNFMKYKFQLITERNHIYLRLSHECSTILTILLPVLYMIMITYFSHISYFMHHNKYSSNENINYRNRNIGLTFQLGNQQVLISDSICVELRVICIK